jgi:hypothetical protein
MVTVQQQSSAIGDYELIMCYANSELQEVPAKTAIQKELPLCFCSIVTDAACGLLVVLYNCVITPPHARQKCHKPMVSQLHAACAYPSKQGTWVTPPEG